MEKYRLRKGVILTEICGEYLLVASPKARPYCKKVKKINKTAGRLLQLMGQSSFTVEDMVLLICEEYQVDNEGGVLRDMELFLESLRENGYVLKEDQ